MTRDTRFHYRPACMATGCQGTAIYKIAASWSDGTSHELKSYGLVCEKHRLEQWERARLRSSLLSQGAGEVVGPVEVFRLEAGRRDAELTRINNDPA